ncbi:unnamed protein product [Cuscuta epithymum]|uniref:Uncharacterized protein n=1 Tax=Cuscuta epithymum TaxID=186058 RepID=A0AAV0E0Q6_9ASTE|nr:unnamed protein product [Cuscuta epithymum]
MYLNCLPFLSEINFNGSTMGGQTLGDVSLTPSIISLPAIYLLRIPISHYSFHVHSSSFDCKLGVFSSVCCEEKRRRCHCFHTIE